LATNLGLSLGAAVAVTVAGFVSLEGWSCATVSRYFAACGHVALVAVLRIVVVVHVAMEVGGAVEPVTGADEDAIIEPLGAVVAVRNAVVGGVVVIAVGAVGLGAEGYGDRGGGGSCGDEQEDAGRGCGKKAELDGAHEVISLTVGVGVRGNRCPEGVR
jgi:hypothetical protein